MHGARECLEGSEPVWPAARLSPHGSSSERATTRTLARAVPPPSEAGAVTTKSMSNVVSRMKPVAICRTNSPLGVPTCGG